MTERGAAIGLSEAIATLREELSSALEAGSGSRLRFRANTVQLDVDVALTREGGGFGGVRFWVVSAEARGSVSHSVTHRLSLNLELVDMSTEETGVLIGDDLSESPE
ncbi:trypco2 family protein [Streptomyces sp. NPDC046909]|uniref:trypco2 family protein n=1 Tax=Streptomyces sp. NPDC046909 TaxID=3155617 RepID=UPI0033FDBDB6